jgi:rhamnosyltransferase
MKTRQLVSVVIRTLNEQKHLVELLDTIQRQDQTYFEIETVIIDSGSTDNTLKIAESYGCRITHIKKEDFTFGKSLNDGCDFANGDYLVFVSGHCIPVN